MERPAPHVCDTCQRDVASLLCQQCLLGIISSSSHSISVIACTARNDDEIEQCTECASRRHRFGGLTKHTFTLLRLRVSIADGILRGIRLASCCLLAVLVECC
jgi:hypothetical protein